MRFCDYESLDIMQNGEIKTFESFQDHMAEMTSSTLGRKGRAGPDPAKAGFDELMCDKFNL